MGQHDVGDDQSSLRNQAGGVLSPILFALYVNDVIEKVRRSSHGCQIGELFLGCIVYADDLILMSASLCDLQAMVGICVEELESIDMKLNIKKSQVMRIGRSFCASCQMISLNDAQINYVEKLKYLGCFLVSAKSFKVSLHEMRVKCYKSFNALYSKCCKFTEPVLLHLVSAHCKPFLLYGMEAVSLSNTELNSLNYTYSNAICKIFKVSHCSVEDILHFTQEPNINNCWLTRRPRLFQRGSVIGNHVVNFLCDLLCA